MSCNDCKYIEIHLIDGVYDWHWCTKLNVALGDLRPCKLFVPEGETNE